MENVDKALRRRIAQLSLKAGRHGSHIGGAMSAVEILRVLYGITGCSTAAGADRVILSKGHAALALYAVLEHYGILTAEQTDTFETNGTMFHAHACACADRCIGFSGGSLSLGFSFAVGVALACLRRNLGNRVFVVVGDGECDEGLVWEAAMSAAAYRLSNLTVIIDRNDVQLDGPTAEIMDTGDIAEKFRSFGFDTAEIDGHNPDEILKALSQVSGKPRAVVAHTIKGKGLSFAEGQASWHHNIMTESLYRQALADLGYDNDR